MIQQGIIGKIKRVANGPASLANPLGAGKVSPPVPRLAATVLLIRDRGGLEVLMVERNEQTYFASALVFPGGIVEPDDGDEAWLGLTDGHATLTPAERALRIAAYRELFEETGVLLTGAGIDDLDRNPDPGTTAFRDLVAGRDARLDLAAMHPFAHWITPETSPKRYDTHFRLCGLDTELTAVSDGLETVSVEWLRPADALAMGKAGERKLLFPTRLNLEMLAASSSVDGAIAAAQGREIVTVTPQIERRAEGMFLTVPTNAGYGGAEEFVSPPRPA
jgi:8-oxo-dGTP pyrophosphatase MutT (NUDIX family)